MSAYVQPIAHSYLDRLTGRLSEAGMRCTPYIMQSNCGVDTVKNARQIPITMIESGPASGVWGAAALGRLIGEPNAIAIDIGGTTAKCGLITGGQVKLNTNYMVERTGVLGGISHHGARRRPGGNRQRRRLDRLGRRISSDSTSGRRAPGAVPGPVSYGSGGTEATTTDANLELGCINPHYFCGGKIVADMAAVEQALGQAGRDASAPIGTKPRAASSASPTTTWSTPSS